MYREIYTKKNSGGIIVAIHSGDSSRYAYFNIFENGTVKMTDCLNDCYKNDYWLDYASSEALSSLAKIEELLTEKEEISCVGDTEFYPDDIPF